MTQTSIEDLLKTRELNFADKILTSPIRNKPAQRNCTYEDFIAMVRKIILNTIPDCIFVPQEEVRNLMQPDTPFAKPIISFEVISRSPRRAQKPMLRNEVIESAYSEEASRIGTLYAWEMDCDMQFNLYAESYDAAQATMNAFEEAILGYTGYLKKNGVIEILFKQQTKDTALELFREHVSVRSLQYRVLLEKYWIDFESTLDSAVVQNQDQ